jgi:hypothetical protein
MYANVDRFWGWQIGIPVEEMSKLDANENLHPVPEEMMV